MRVVIDTNVVVSAILHDRDPEIVLFFVLDHEEIEWVASKQIVDEYVEVLGRPKFHLDPEKTASWRGRFTRAITYVDAETLTVEFPRDRKDAKFLACSIVAAADFFITGDRDFEGAQNLVETKIVSVRQFMELVMTGSN
jgi:putative PIN family toxin of toxin-antitoxin system